MPRAVRPSNTGRHRCAGCGNTPPYFHNGSAATLKDVVTTYNARQTLGLNGAQVNDLVEYLKSL